MIAAAALCVQGSSQHRPQISQVCSFPKKIRKSRLMHQKYFQPLALCISKSSNCKNMIQEIFCTRESVPLVSRLISE
jgi:hypothetical protein